MIDEAPFSESSQVARLLTEREGFVTVLARGSYRDKTGFGGPLDVLTAGLADLSTRRSSDLELLHSFPLQRPWRGLRGSLVHWLAAGSVLELLRPFSWPKDRAADLYELACATLDVLDAADGRDAIEACVAYWSARLLVIAGFRPRLDACCVCQSDLASNGGDGDATFSPRFGGVLCAKCRARDPRAPRCTFATLDLLRRLLGESTQNGAASPDDLREARVLLDRFAEERLERPLSAARWLEDGVPPATR